LAPAPAVHALLAPYLEAIAKLNNDGPLRRYPGSPLLALSLIRPQDRLIACELEPQAAAALANNLRADKRAKAIAIDGFVAVNAYVPPKERRGLVLIDPPFEDGDEFSRLGKSLEDASQMGNRHFLAWYPRKDPHSAQVLAMRIKRSGIAKLLRVELDLGGDAQAGRRRVAGRQSAMALEQELTVLLPELARGGAGWRPQLDRSTGSGR
jgi:23S rRNA (adenine2030-N6)-methyltransferase